MSRWVYGFLFLAQERVSRRKRRSWEIPSEFSQIDPSSLLRHLRKAEGSLGLDCTSWERTPGEAQLWVPWGVGVKSWKPISESRE